MNRLISELSQHTHLGIEITPTDVINKKSGELVIFTCSYNSTEDMTIEFERKYKNQQNDSILKLNHIPGLFRVLSQGKISSAEIAIEEDLLSVDCVLRDPDSKERARVSTLIKGTGMSKPALRCEFFLLKYLTVISVSDLVIPRISNCYDEPKFVHVNEDLDLICEATGSPQPETKWYIVKNGNYKSVDTVDGVHVVTRAQLDQNGTIYMCIARNSIGDDKCTTHVIVKGQQYSNNTVGTSAISLTSCCVKSADVNFCLLSLLPTYIAPFSMTFIREVPNDDLSSLCKGRGR